MHTESLTQVWENQRFYGLLFGWYNVHCIHNAHVDAQHKYKPYPVTHPPHPVTAQHHPHHLPHRQIPALLERPPWSDDAGQPVTLPDTPNDAERATGHSKSGWVVHVSPATDADGWQYASVFKYAVLLMICLWWRRMHTLVCISSSITQKCHKTPCASRHHPHHQPID